MSESEKDNPVRMERILLAALDREEYPTELLEKNLEKIGDFDFTYDGKIEKRTLSEAKKMDSTSHVSVNINHFQGRVYSVEVPKEERKIWITKAILNLTDGNTDYDCLPLTDWKIGLPIEEARFKSKKIDLVVKPFDIIFDENETRRLFLVLDVLDKS